MGKANRIDNAATLLRENIRKYNESKSYSKTRTQKGSKAEVSEKSELGEKKTNRSRQGDSQKRDSVRQLVDLTGYKPGVTKQGYGDSTEKHIETYLSYRSQNSGVGEQNTNNERKQFFKAFIPKNPSRKDAKRNLGARNVDSNRDVKPALSYFKNDNLSQKNLRNHFATIKKDDSTGDL